MKGTRVFPRATNILRSVMIAGAGTAIWMALSATAANADSGSADNHTLLGEASSNVSAAVSSATDAVGSVAKAADPPAKAQIISIPVPNVPLPAPKAVVPTKPMTIHVPVVTPIVEHVGGSVGTIVGTVPVVNHVVPAETVENVVDTVVAPVTGSVDQTVEAVVPPVNDGLAPLGLEPVTDVTNPIVQPIVDVVDTVLLPVATVVPPVVPGLPPLAGGGSEPPEIPAGDTAPGVGTLPGSGVVSSPEGEAVAGTPPRESSPAQVEQLALATAAPVLPNTRVLGYSGTVPAVGAAATSNPRAPAELPADPKAVPAGLAGAGSGNSQNGPPTPAAAFLHGGLIIPADSLSDLVTVSDEHHPKPVCFDPGSSPD
ncbi:hypothetical protein SAMN04487912_10853 [Arthrobacter sp. cf158]|uniref:hypothetical protein n=1 Tax=Arthrobacter sp. cf158 TaxID=1761744 RepID=UPI0008967262|nr:hypothetical protein [Arthrobacter sp. cf158]SDX17944.1 hypothetical protein SAMN04487912_10853 [Arthrobacter sp. cf158]